MAAAVATASDKASTEDSRQWQLKSPPSDGITAVKFAPSGHNLVASSWDCSVRVYDADKNMVIGSYQHKAPVLCCDLASATIAISGGLDHTIRHCDIGRAESQRVIGSHSGGVRCLQWSQSLNAAVSGGWDKQVAIWDPRAADAKQASGELSERCFAMCVAEANPSSSSRSSSSSKSSSSSAPSSVRIVAGCADRKLHIFDARSMAKPLETRESPLSQQIRSLAAFPSGGAFAISSVEGRVAIEMLDGTPSAHGSSSSSSSGSSSATAVLEPSLSQFSFRCHRTKVEGAQVAFPVNCLAFHPSLGGFASGGCDGEVCTWDAYHRRRLSRWGDFPASIAAIDFSSDGALAAIASSYTFEEGEKEHEADAIFVRRVEAKEVTPKAKKAK